MIMSRKRKPQHYNPERPPVGNPLRCPDCNAKVFTARHDYTTGEDFDAATLVIKHDAGCPGWAATLAERGFPPGSVAGEIITADHPLWAAANEILVDQLGRRS